MYLYFLCEFKLEFVALAGKGPLRVRLSTPSVAKKELSRCVTECRICAPQGV